MSHSVVARESGAVVATAPDPVDLREQDGTDGKRRPSERALAALLLLLAGALGSSLVGSDFPDRLRVQIGSWVETGIEWSYDNLAWLYDVPARFLELILDGLLLFLTDMPAPTLALLLVLIAGWRGGLGVAALAGATLAVTVAVGLWDPMLETLALMTVAVGVSAVVGVAVGVVAARSRAAQRTVVTVLDAMQTFPVFAYLVPAVFIFGPGNVAALVVTIIWALPPITRMTMVGLNSVPEETRESVASLGTTRWQSLRGVDIPIAQPSIRAGLNQTIMYAMAMVIIAAMIGASGLGQPVWSSLTRLEFGRAFEAGVVLVLLAMVMDRASEGRGGPARRGVGRLRWIALGAFTAAAAVVQFVPALLGADFNTPPAWLDFSIRQPIDDSIDWVNLNLGFVLDPTIAGIEQYAIRPLMDLLLWLPWTLVVLGTAAVSLLLRGPRAAVLVAVATTLIGALGMWDAAGQTLATAGLALVIVLIIAFPTGIIMSRSTAAERVLRPVLDVLQTLPIFLFVIPAVVLFGPGPVAGVLATVLYAVAPVIRLTNVALRTVDPEPVEAATSAGATDGQVLRQVRIPLGLPTLMVGVNQGIMLCLAMAVVSAFVGTPGLGQDLLVGVHTGRLDIGVDAGVAMFLLAVVVDRLLAGVSTAVQQRNHLEPA